MAEAALAHGPWALFHSSDLMRQLIADVKSAFAERQSSADNNGKNLLGVYTARDVKTAHSRPLPLPDALLQGTPDNVGESYEAQHSAEWLAEVAETPWLWELQWATLAILFISPSLRQKLEHHCPHKVAEQWLQLLENRVHAKLLGESVEEGFPDTTAAMTPLMLVVSEMLLLRTTYEL